MEAGRSRVPIRMKPLHTRIDSRLRWIAIAGLALNALWWCWSLAERAASPRRYDGYRFRSGEPPADWPYPIDEVAWWIGLFAAEMVVLSLLLRRVKGGTGGLCFLLALLCGGAGFFGGIMAMHAPAPYGIQIVLLFTSGVWLLAMVLVTGFAKLVVRDLEAEAPVADPPPPARVVRR